jgi:hypothetical protein
MLNRCTDATYPVSHPPLFWHPLHQDNQVSNVRNYIIVFHVSANIFFSFQHHFLGAKDRPNRDELDEGALKMFGYAQDFFRSLGFEEIRPIHPRYLNNFDDSGRHHNDVASPTIKGQHRFKAIPKQGTAKRMMGSISMTREAE